MNKKDEFIVDLNDEIFRLGTLNCKQRTRKVEENSYQYIVSRVEETFSDQPELKKQIMDILDNLDLSLDCAYMNVGTLLDPYIN